MQLPHLRHRPVNSSSVIAPGGRNGTSPDPASPVFFANRPNPRPAEIAIKALLVAGNAVPVFTRVSLFDDFPRFPLNDPISSSRSWVAPSGQMRAHHSLPEVNASIKSIVIPDREMIPETKSVAV